MPKSYRLATTKSSGEIGSSHTRLPALTDGILLLAGRSGHLPLDRTEFMSYSRPDRQKFIEWEGLDAERSGQE
jgi:hypothetical protein